MKLLLLAVSIGVSAAQTPDIEQIMSRVGRNQAKTMDARKDWVYTQKQTLRMIRASGTLAREEHREYAIVPKDRGIQKNLAKFDGKYRVHGKDTAYDKPGYQYKGIDIDGQVLDGMSNDMTADNRSRDGIAHDMFPLTYHEQLKYNFKLLGQETLAGRPVYRVAFEPKPKAQAGEDDMLWKGEALIDAEEYQPVRVHTTSTLKIPMAVKILLGTDIRGLGFSVTYQKFAEGVWFPVSYGGEFEVRAAFLYRRKISVAMVNTDFHHTDVNSRIAYAMEDKW
jgi:hypothetical protein